MRVGVDLRGLSDPAWSGVAMYTVRTLEALGRLADSSALSVVAFTSGWRRPSLPRFSCVVQRRHLRVPNRLLNVSLTTLGRPRAEHCFPSVDVVWQPNPLFLADPRRPHFVTVHDLSFLHFPEFFARRTHWWYLRWVTRWLARPHPRAQIICVSAHTRDDLLTAYPHWRGRVAVVPPPPPPLEPATLDDDGRRRYNLRRPYILSLCTVEPRKNLASVVRAFQRFSVRHPTYELLVVGRVTSEWLRRSLAAPGVRFLGYVPAADRPRLYAGASCLVYPSFYEGYGYPPLEAMAAGVPVIASAASALPEILGGAALLVDPYQAEPEITLALEAFHEDPALGRRYRERGYDRLRELHRSFSAQPLLTLWRDATLA